MITETYRDIEIILREDKNVWGFTVNGRERNAPTLPKAREYIDNALDEVKTKKVKEWEPFDVWTEGHYNTNQWRKIQVTSVAEGDRYSGTPYYWTSDPNAEDHYGRKRKERKKVSGLDLYADTPSNAEAIDKILGLHEQVATLETQVRELKEGLTRIELPSKTATA